MNGESPSRSTSPRRSRSRSSSPLRKPPRPQAASASHRLDNAQGNNRAIEQRIHNSKCLGVSGQSEKSENANGHNPIPGASCVMHHASEPLLHAIGRILQALCTSNYVKTPCTPCQQESGPSKVTYVRSTSFTTIARSHDNSRRSRCRPTTLSRKWPLSTRYILWLHLHSIYSFSF